MLGADCSPCEKGTRTSWIMSRVLVSAGRRKGLSHLKHVLQMGVDVSYEICVALPSCNRKCPAFGLNGFRKSAQVGVDQAKKMQGQRIPPA